MFKAVWKLTEMGGSALCRSSPPETIRSGNKGLDVLYQRIRSMLIRKNGYFAFESALHVFPAGPSESGYDLITWNSYDLWRQAFEPLDPNLLFFAEDVFGQQFVADSTRIGRFDPETADVNWTSSNIEEWAARILSDYSYETGYALAHEWQVKNGPIPASNRLVPIVPFVLGGEFSIKNLKPAEASKGMRMRAGIARQIRELPDGTGVRIQVVE